MSAKNQINFLDISVFLKNSNAFKNTHLNTIALISKLIVQENFKKGDIIVAPGDKLPGIYIVFQGTVSISSKFNGKEVFLTLSKGSFFGIHPVIQNVPSSETIVASTDLIVFLMPRKIYKNAIIFHEEIVEGLLIEMSAYLCKMEKENLSRSI